MPPNLWYAKKSPWEPYDRYISISSTYKEIYLPPNLRYAKKTPWEPYDRYINISSTFKAIYMPPNLFILRKLHENLWQIYKYFKYF